MFTVLMMIHMFLSMMIGVDIATEKLYQNGYRNCGSGRYLGCNGGALS